ncbi:MAG: efflux RND transporter periplasmic adaptor subunit [Ginsengibacter sp.]
MKKIIWIIVILVIAAGIYFYFKKRNADKPVSLDTEQMHTGSISNSVTATGTIQPVDTVAVGAQVSGTIQNIYVDFNSPVKKGELLASLDKSLLSDQVNQDRANLKNAQSNLQYQQQNFDRQSKLYNVGAISKADFETAQSSYNTALAAVSSSKAILAAAQRNLSYTNIYSPINGTVLSRNVSEGQTVASSFNTPTLFSIAKDLSKMQVRAAVDEADIGNVKKGQDVTFTVDAFPDDVFKGTVQEVRLQPVVTANVVTYVTIINAENNNLKLKPGMTANITIFLQQDSNANLISAKAISFTPDSSLRRQYQIISSPEKHPASNNDFSFEKSNTLFPPKMETVWVLKGNEIIQRKIMTGMNDNIHVQVLSGLTNDDEVIDGVQEGESVKSMPGQAKSPFMPSRRRQTPGKGSGSSGKGSNG